MNEDSTVELHVRLLGEAQTVHGQRKPPTSGTASPSGMHLILELRHLVNALAELEALGVAFVRLTDNLDLSTPSGRLRFQVIAAMGEFECELIRERVRAGLRNARAKGKRFGRPKVTADGHQVATLRRAGRSWREICRQTGLPKGRRRGRTALRKALVACPKTSAAAFHPGV